MIRTATSTPLVLLIALLGAALLLTICTGCARPLVKTEALNAGLLAEMRRSRQLVLEPGPGEHAVRLESEHWMAVAPDGPLTFAGLRTEAGATYYALVLECDPAQDALRLWPLGDGESPLDALAPARRRELEALRGRYRAGEALSSLRELSLRECIDGRRFAPPLPTPGRIVATAANFRGHLIHDLDVPEEVIARFKETPARVFQKHPPLHAPGKDPRPDAPFKGVIGPFDPVLYPDVVSLPDDEHGVTHVVPTYLDYEVELGFVVGRTLTWADVDGESDETLWSHVAGYTLVSDVKARNPQVFERILARGEVPTEKERRYLTGDDRIDEVIGNWDEETCDWWGYAASQGNYAGLGPYFVAVEGDERFPARALACARSYAPTAVRGAERPSELAPDHLYLRQLERISLEPGAPGRLLWDPPAVLRAVLSPTSALRQSGAERRLEAGDVVALGTPGGIALTVNRSRIYGLLDRLLFWWDAIDWHDAFFERDRPRYLQHGDEVFLWGEGLGYQHSLVQRLELPPLPETVEDPEAEEVEARAEAQARREGLDETVEQAQEPAVETPLEEPLR